MNPLVADTADRLEREATMLSVAELANYLQDALGQRMAAYMAGLNDAKQIGRYRKPGGPAPSARVERRLREGYKAVRMIADCYDVATARNWLFGTNSRLDEQAPVGVLRTARQPEDFSAVVRAARQFAAADV